MNVCNGVAIEVQLKCTVSHAICCIVPLLFTAIALTLVHPFNAATKVLNDHQIMHTFKLVTFTCYLSYSDTPTLWQLLRHNWLLLNWWVCRWQVYATHTFANELAQGHLKKDELLFLYMFRTHLPNMVSKYWHLHVFHGVHRCGLHPSGIAHKLATWGWQPMVLDQAIMHWKWTCAIHMKVPTWNIAKMVC